MMILLCSRKGTGPSSIPGTAGPVVTGSRGSESAAQGKGRLSRGGLSPVRPLRKESVGDFRRAADGDGCAGRGRGAALDRLQEVGRLHEGDRVHGLAVEPDLVMEVAAGRAAGRAHISDQLAAL